MPYSAAQSTDRVALLRNDRLSPLFMAVIEATEEAIINSLLAAESMRGHSGHEVPSIPQEKVLQLLRDYGRITE